MSDGDGILMWEFTCPGCGDVHYRPIPEAGDRIECDACDWTDEVAEVEVDA